MNCELLRLKQRTGEVKRAAWRGAKIAMKEKKKKNGRTKMGITVRTTYRS
jgi:hypothetical protein